MQRKSSKDGPQRKSSKEVEFTEDGDKVAPPAPVPRRPPEDDAANLARKYRLDLHEVQYMVKAFRLADIRAGANGLTPDDMHNVMCMVFDVPKVQMDIVNDAFKHAVEPGSPKRKSDTDNEPSVLEKFCTWYQVNMFKSVASLDVSKADQLTYELGRKHSVSPLVIDKIKKKFDMYDSDGSGLIDFDEFLSMLANLLSAKSREDIAQDRVKRFWGEIDCDGSGEVDFEEFTAWYLRYFDPELLESGMSSGPVSQFYASFNPTLQRRQSKEKGDSFKGDSV